MKKVWLMVFILLLAGCGKSVPATVEEVPLPEEEPVKSVIVSCAGDCTLGTDVAFGGMTLPEEVFARNGDYGWFFRNVLPIFEKDDLTIVNLEGTFTTRGTRKEKTYAFRGSPEYTNILITGGVDAVTLANNHSRDYGDVSLDDTKEALDMVGIWWAENRNTFVKEINGIKVGVIGLDDITGSALPLVPETIGKVKEDGAELIVVQVHWGIEKEAIPTARQVEIAHTAIDMGADMVIGHHPHVLQGIEEYKGKMIVYSLGNFCFGGNQNPEDKDAMIFQQTFTFENGEILPDAKWQVYPCRISSETGRNNYQPTPVFGKEGEAVRRKIQERTNAVCNLTVNFATEE